MAGRRNLKWLAVAGAGSVLVLLHGWALLALYFWFSGQMGVALAAAAGYGVMLGMVMRLSRTPAHGAWVSLVLVAVVAAWWTRREPEPGLSYPPATEQPARLEEELNFMTVHGMRDFRYRSASDFDARWSTRSFDLEALREVDLFFCYSGVPGVAHVMTGFVFKDQPPLVVSIEPRVEREEPDTLLRGFFKQYELCYIWADERDLIQFRTRCRGEHVILHRTSLTPEQGRRLLSDMARRSNALEAAPEFYHTLTDNRENVIARHVAPVMGVGLPWYRRPLLTGKYERLGYDAGWLVHTLPWESCRAAAMINERAGAAAEAPDFSRLIRSHLPVKAVEAYPAD